MIHQPLCSAASRLAFGHGCGTVDCPRVKRYRCCWCCLVQRLIIRHLGRSRQHLETLCPAAQAFVALLRTAAIARVGKQVDNKKLYSSVEFAPSCRFNALQQRAARRATEHIRAVTPGSMYPTATYTTSNGHNSIAVIWVRISFRPDSDGWQRTENAITLQHFESLTLPRSERIKLAILRARHQPIQTARTVGRKAAKVAKMAIVIPFNVVGTIAIAPIVILVYISLTLSDNHVRNNRLPTLPLHHVELFLYRLISRLLSRSWLPEGRNAIGTLVQLPRWMGLRARHVFRQMTLRLGRRLLLFLIAGLSPNIHVVHVN